MDEKKSKDDIHRILTADLGRIVSMEGVLSQLGSEWQRWVLPSYGIPDVNLSEKICRLYDTEPESAERFANHIIDIAQTIVPRLDKEIKAEADDLWKRSGILAQQSAIPSYQYDVITERYGDLANRITQVSTLLYTVDSLLSLKKESEDSNKSLEKALKDFDYQSGLNAVMIGVKERDFSKAVRILNELAGLGEPRPKEGQSGDARRYQERAYYILESLRTYFHDYLAKAISIVKKIPVTGRYPLNHIESEPVQRAPEPGRIFKWKYDGVFVDSIIPQGIIGKSISRIYTEGDKVRILFEDGAHLCVKGGERYFNVENGPWLWAPDGSGIDETLTYFPIRADNKVTSATRYIGHHRSPIVDQFTLSTSRGGIHLVSLNPKDNPRDGIVKHGFIPKDLDVLKPVEEYRLA